MPMEVAELVAAISKGKGAKFASLTYRAKESGEKARHTVILGASTQTLYERDIEKLQDMIPTLEGLKLTAALALLESRQKSLTVGIGHNPEYTCEGVYVFPEGLKGIKVHIVSGRLYVDGLQENKVVLEPGEYKPVNSGPLTIAKNEIRKVLPSGRFRQFILGNVSLAKVNGEVLEIETAD